MGGTKTDDYVAVTSTNVIPCVGQRHLLITALYCFFAQVHPDTIVGTVLSIFQGLYRSNKPTLISKATLISQDPYAEV